MTQENTSGAAVSLTSRESRAIALANDIIERFGLSDLRPLLLSAQQQQHKRQLNVAVFGRFKAGKSSFLNQIIGGPLLPIGVVPVTSVVTEISCGTEEAAELVLCDGHRVPGIPLSGISQYISESENPENVKGIESVRIFLPALARFPELRFIDTPGLESIHTHSTEASLSWSPNVDLALVAVGVDPPLTQHDISLIARLLDLTPRVSVLLTKVDLLDEPGQQEVLRYVETQLRSRFSSPVPVFPFSIKPGFENLRDRFEREFLQQSLRSFHDQREAVLARKLQTLLRSSEDYLLLALKSVEAFDADREHLRSQVLGSDQSTSDQKLQLRLLARHAAVGTRPAIQTHLERAVLGQLQTKLSLHLRELLPTWRGSFAPTLAQFETWLRAELTAELTALSATERNAFLEPLRELERRCRGNLQSFRDQLSERVQRAYGMPLRTDEIEIEVDPPRSPDISVGRVFDHNWELISWLIPMPLVRRAVERRFLEKAETEVYKNLSRLTSQWEEAILAAIHSMEQQAERRLEEFVLTVQRLLSTGESESRACIESYLSEIRSLAGG